MPSSEGCCKENRLRELIGTEEREHGRYRSMDSSLFVAVTNALAVIFHPTARFRGRVLDGKENIRGLWDSRSLRQPATCMQYSAVF